MKKYRKEKIFLEELDKLPNISVACQKVGISRNTVYQWRHKDKAFKKRMDDSLDIGIESINDLAESTVIKKIQDGDMSAAKYWLDNHKRNYVKPRIKNYEQGVLKENLEAQKDVFDELLEEMKIMSTQNNNDLINPS